MLLKSASLIIAGIVGAVAVVSSQSYADGPLKSYDNPAVTASLSPGEYQTNVDGAQEDPNAKMSDVARAYRNGLINGKKSVQADVPPLPDSPPDDQVTPVAVAPVQADQQPEVQEVHRPVAPTTVVQVNAPPPQAPAQVAVVTETGPGVYTTTEEYHTKTVHQTKSLTPEQYLQEQQILHAQPLAQQQQQQPSVQVNYQAAQQSPQEWVQAQMNDNAPQQYQQQQPQYAQQQYVQQQPQYAQQQYAVPQPPVQQYAQVQVPVAQAYSPIYYAPYGGSRAYVVHRVPAQYYAAPVMRGSQW